MFLKIHAVRSANRYLTSPHPLTLVILMVCTDHTDDHHEVPTSYARSENLTFEEAERRINAIAKVIQLAIFPSDPDRSTVLGSRAWERGVEGEDPH